MEFYDKLEAKVYSLFKNPQQVEIYRNQPPPYYAQINNTSSLSLGLHRYYDQQKGEVVAYPRHGSFEIRVNDMLIFSKIQSNLWPNIEKIGSIIAEIMSAVNEGKDIKRYSLQYRLENEEQDQHFIDTYKKVLRFKINKRPFSSQFNASSYVSKMSDPNTELKNSTFKRRNIASLKKGG